MWSSHYYPIGWGIETWIFFLCRSGHSIQFLAKVYFFFCAWPKPHTTHLRVFVRYLIFLCWSAHFTQFLVKKFWLFDPNPYSQPCRREGQKQFICVYEHTMQFLAIFLVLDYVSGLSKAPKWWALWNPGGCTKHPRKGLCITNQ